MSKTGKPRIDDFGEVIGGAAKHRRWHARWEDTMKTAQTSETSTLNAQWPAPNWAALIAEGADASGVDAARAVRDSIPPPPPKYMKDVSKYWRREVAKLRDVMIGAMSAGFEQREDEIIDAVGTFDRGWADRWGGGRANLHAWHDRREMYMAAGHGRSFRNVRVGHLTTGVSGRKLIALGRAENDTFPTILFERGRLVGDREGYDDLEDAAADWGNIVARRQSQRKKGGDTLKHKVKCFVSNIPAKTNYKRYFIGIRMLGRGELPHAMYVFDTKREMFDFYKDEGARIHKKAEAMLEQQNHRQGFGTPRVGPVARTRDMDEESMTRVFAPRGVQFGNTMPQKERARHMNATHDALEDLSFVTGIDKKSLMLNGDLALAFGARGRGGLCPAKAHYEPDRKVINLTRANGAGSLAHEWWHAFDDSNAEGAGRYGTSHNGPHAIAFGTLMGAISKMPYHDRCELKNTIHRRTGRLGDYWKSPIEMSARAFETFVIERLKAAGRSNEYLAQVTPFKVWSRDEQGKLTEDPKSLEAVFNSINAGMYPYPTPDEARTLDKHFCNVIRETLGVEPPTHEELEKHALETEALRESSELAKPARDIPQANRNIELARVNARHPVSFRPGDGQGDIFQSMAAGR